MSFFLRVIIIKTASSSLTDTNLLVFVKEMQCVLGAVRTDFNNN